jgi:hypothetical protein
VLRLRFVVLLLTHADEDVCRSVPLTITTLSPNGSPISADSSACRTPTSRSAPSRLGCGSGCQATPVEAGQRLIDKPYRFRQRATPCSTLLGQIAAGSRAPGRNQRYGSISDQPA